MMRSNMFANIENKFEFAAKDVIKSTAIQSFAELIAGLQGVLNTEAIFGMMVVIARLGVSGDGVLNQAEKDLIDEVFGRIYKGSMEQVYAAIGTTIPDTDYEMIGNLAKMGNHIAMPLLHCILSFAYIDQVMEDHVAERLDGLFGMNLMMEFFNSDLEEVPRPAIRLTGPEAEIVEWFKSDDQFRPLADIQKHFPGKSIAELKCMLDGLCQKGVLYGGDDFIGCMYGLDSADVNYVVVPASANSNTSGKQGKPESEQEPACNEHKPVLPSRRPQEIERDNTIRAYVEARSQWEEKLHKAEADREAEIRKQLAQTEKTLIAEAEKNLKDHLDQNNELREALRQKRNEAEKALAALGFFKFSEKKQNQQIIEDTEIRLAQLDKDDVKLTENHWKRLSGISKEAETQREEIRLRVEKAYPLPVPPEKPENMIPSQGYMVELILNHMKHGVDYTVTDLIAQIPALSDAGISNVRPALTPLIEQGIVERTERNGKVIFSLAQRRTAQSRFAKPPKTKSAVSDKEVLAQIILKHMKYGVDYTVTDLIAQIPELSGLGISTVRPALTPLMEQGVVERIERNGKAVFRLK